MVRPLEVIVFVFFLCADVMFPCLVQLRKTLVTKKTLAKIVRNYARSVFVIFPYTFVHIVRYDSDSFLRRRPCALRVSLKQCVNIKFMLPLHLPVCIFGHWVNNAMLLLPLLKLIGEVLERVGDLMWIGEIEKVGGRLNYRIDHFFLVK